MKSILIPVSKYLSFFFLSANGVSGHWGQGSTIDNPGCREAGDVVKRVHD